MLRQLRIEYLHEVIYGPTNGVAKFLHVDLKIGANDTMKELLSKRVIEIVLPVTGY